MTRLEGVKRHHCLFPIYGNASHISPIAFLSFRTEYSVLCILLYSKSSQIIFLEVDKALPENNFSNCLFLVEHQLSHDPEQVQVGDRVIKWLNAPLDSLFHPDIRKQCYMMYRSKE